jgi:peroxiredoxin
MLRTALLSVTLLMSYAVAQAQVVPGQPAPAFTLTDLQGKPVRLSDFRGQHVVLEWTNPHCPFVKKHYDSGNMQALQKRFTASKVAWLTINSTHTGHAEFMQPQAKAAWIAQRGAAPTAVLGDADGKVGKLYGARTTPHMYVIDPQGKLIYAGAIDNKRSANPADVKTADNHVTQALNEALAGKPVAVASTQPYGCSVKYSD